MNDTNTFLDSLVPSPKKETQLAETKKNTDNSKLSGKGASSNSGQENIIFSIKKDIEFDLEKTSSRAVPTMIHLPSKTRKELEALVLSLQNKYKRKFTVSQIGAMLIEKSLSE